MTYTMTYVGGPYDGDTREHDSLGTTWSRSTIYDDKGNVLGFYHHEGPSFLELKWIPIEEHRKWLERVGWWLSQRDEIAFDIEAHITKLLEGSDDDSEI